MIEHLPYPPHNHPPRQAKGGAWVDGCPRCDILRHVREPIVGAASDTSRSVQGVSHNEKPADSGNSASQEGEGSGLPTSQKPGGYLGGINRPNVDNAPVDVGAGECPNCGYDGNRLTLARLLHERLRPWLSEQTTWEYLSAEDRDRWTAAVQGERR